MPIPAIRPRFRLQLDLDSGEVMQRLQSLVHDPSIPCQGLVAAQQGHVDLRVPEADRHLWSPALSVEVVGTGPQSSEVRAMIGPNPAVWTGVAFCYLGLGCGALFLLTLGAVQLGLGNTAWGLPLAAVLLALLGVVWWFSLQGRKWAAPQAAVLRALLEQTLLPEADEKQLQAADPYRE